MAQKTKTPSKRGLCECRYLFSGSWVSTPTDSTQQSNTNSEHGVDVTSRFYAPASAAFAASVARIHSSRVEVPAAHASMSAMTNVSAAASRADTSARRNSPLWYVSAARTRVSTRDCTHAGFCSTVVTAASSGLAVTAREQKRPARRNTFSNSSADSSSPSLITEPDIFLCSPPRDYTPNRR
jgi:hypothetical protein